MGRPAGSENFLIKSSILVTHAIDVLNAANGQCGKADIVDYLDERFGIKRREFNHAIHNARTSGWVQFHRKGPGNWETTDKGDQMLIRFEKVAGVVIGLREVAA